MNVFAKEKYSPDAYLKEPNSKRKSKPLIFKLELSN